jgi:hypothetical protein
MGHNAAQIRQGGGIILARKQDQGRCCNSAAGWLTMIRAQDVYAGFLYANLYLMRSKTLP